MTTGNQFMLQRYKIAKGGGGFEYAGSFGYRVLDRVGREKGFKHVLVSPNFKTEGECTKWIYKHLKMTDAEIIKEGKKQ